MLGFIPVESSSIEAVKHEGNTLIVLFKSGEMYKYEGISANEFNDLVNAESVGKHFHRHVRTVKKYTKFVNGKVA